MIVDVVEVELVMDEGVVLLAVVVAAAALLALDPSTASGADDKVTEHVIVVSVLRRTPYRGSWRRTARDQSGDLGCDPASVDDADHAI